MKELLFVYGTLKDSDVQQKVIGRAVQGEKDCLKNFRKTKLMIDNEIYPSIAPDNKSIVFGKVLAIDKDELEKVDDYESSSYERIRVTLESGKSAWVYIQA